MLTNFKKGDKCQLYPGDSYKKFVKILDINKLGYEFEFIEGTEKGSDYKAGDIVFFNHAKVVTLKKL
jgi:hypothetical protein